MINIYFPEDCWQIAVLVIFLTCLFFKNTVYFFHIFTWENISDVTYFRVASLIYV